MESGAVTMAAMSSHRPRSARQENPIEGLGRALVLLARIAVRCPKAGPEVEKAVEILEGVQRQLRPSIRGRDVEPVPGRGPRRPISVQFYRVERIGDEDALAEYRSSRPQPFRCSESLFRAVVAVLGEARVSLKAGELCKAVGRTLNGAPALYLVRLVLRFLVAGGLVSHQHARFHSALPPGKLGAEARRLWRKAEAGPLPGPFDAGG